MNEAARLREVFDLADHHAEGFVIRRKLIHVCQRHAEFAEFLSLPKSTLEDGISDDDDSGAERAAANLENLIVRLDEPLSFDDFCWHFYQRTLFAHSEEEIVQRPPEMPAGAARDGRAPAAGGGSRAQPMLRRLDSCSSVASYFQEDRFDVQFEVGRLREVLDMVSKELASMWEEQLTAARESVTAEQRYEMDLLREENERLQQQSPQGLDVDDGDNYPGSGGTGDEPVVSRKRSVKPYVLPEKKSAFKQAMEKAHNIEGGAMEACRKAYEKFDWRNHSQTAPPSGVERDSDSAPEETPRPNRGKGGVDSVFKQFEDDTNDAKYDAPRKPKRHASFDEDSPGNSSATPKESRMLSRPRRKSIASMFGAGAQKPVQLREVPMVQVEQDTESSSGGAETSDEEYNRQRTRAKANRMSTRQGTVALRQDFGQQKQVFADAVQMKEMVRQALTKEEYDVSNFYFEDGIAANIARSPRFDNITLWVILVNAVWIWIDADYNKATTLPQAEMHFQIAENFFCLYFAFEIMVRFVAFERKLNCFKDGWFCADAFLIVMMIFETWILSLFVILSSGDDGGNTDVGNSSLLKLIRLMRLTRVARVARLLRAMPELMILVKGISVATRSVFFTLFLLFMIIYVFAIFFVQLCEEDAAGQMYFPTVPDAITALLLEATLPDFAQMVYNLGEVNPAYSVVLLIFILMASLTVMNMLIGVLCEVVSVVSAVEKEQLVLTFVKEQLLRMLDCPPSEAELRMITKEEFQSLMITPDVARVMKEVGVDVLALVDLVGFIYKDRDAIDFATFMEIVLQFRGTQNATVKDIVDLRQFIVNELTAVRRQMEKDIQTVVTGVRTSVKRQSRARLEKMRATVSKGKRPMSGEEPCAIKDGTVGLAVEHQASALSASAATPGRTASIQSRMRARFSVAGRVSDGADPYNGEGKSPNGRKSRYQHVRDVRILNKEKVEEKKPSNGDDSTGSAGGDSNGEPTSPAASPPQRDARSQQKPPPPPPPADVPANPPELGEDSVEAVTPWRSQGRRVGRELSHAPDLESLQGLYNGPAGGLYNGPIANGSQPAGFASAEQRATFSNSGASTPAGSAAGSNAGSNAGFSGSRSLGKRFAVRPDDVHYRPPKLPSFPPEMWEKDFELPDQGKAFSLPQSPTPPTSPPPELAPGRTDMSRKRSHMRDAAPAVPSNRQGRSQLDGNSINTIPLGVPATLD
eukprot:TRINITY_DN7799_c0_g2_i1.p1 TRINITY_DN7799_c0_g2~~TRINITY_DN7799_c0_g2_i1.p1  ORF type:complete len:1208 (-),score=322.23 TRINITY_DN7799_c0_g2_i1:67-3690(-)